MTSAIAQEIAFVAGLSVKAAAVFGAGALLMLLLRRSSASMRHSAGTMVIWSAAILPIAAFVLPGFELPVLPARAATLDALAPAISRSAPSFIPQANEKIDAIVGAASKASRPLRRASRDFENRADSSSTSYSFSNGTSSYSFSAASAAQPQPLPAANSLHLMARIRRLLDRMTRPLTVAVALSLAAGLVWLFGALALWARLVAGMRRVARLTREGTPAAPEMQAMLVRAASSLGVKTARPVRLLIHPEVSVAMTAGAHAPVVLLPMSSTSWSEARQRVVLLHELAHIRRGDWLQLISSEIALAVWWFHPLAWWLSRSVRRDAEQAADDLVLDAGTRPSDYAAHLLEIVRGLRDREEAPRPAMAMAQLAGIEERVRSILDGQRSRKPGIVQRRALGFALGAAVLLIAVARPTAAHAREELGQPDSSRQVALAPDPHPHPSPNPHPRPDAHPHPTPNPQPRFRIAIADEAPRAPLPPLPPVAPVAPVAPMAPLPPLAPMAPLPPEAMILQMARDADGQLSKPDREALKKLRTAMADQQSHLSDMRIQLDARRADMNAAREQANEERAQASSERDRANVERQQARMEREQANIDRVTADAERMAEDYSRQAGEYAQQALQSSDFTVQDDGDDGVHINGHVKLDSDKLSAQIHDALRKASVKLAGLGHSRNRHSDDDEDDDDAYDRGMRLHHRGRFKEAMTAFQKSIDNDQRVEDATYNIACDYAQLNDAEHAAEWLKRAADEGFDVEGSVGHDDDFDPVRSDPKFRAAVQEIRSQRGSRHSSEAKALERRYTRLESRNPKAAGPWESIGRELLDAGSYDLAVKAFHAAADRSDDKANPLYNAACALSIKGDKTAALEALELAIQLGFDDVHHLKTDDDLDNIRDEPRFKDLIQLARDLELDVSRGSFELNFGSVHVWQHKNNKKRNVEDVAHYQEMAKKHSDLGRAWYNLGYAQIVGDDPAGAEASFAKSLSLGYRKAASTYNIACAQARQGHKDAAIDSLKKAQELGYDIGDSMGSDDDLESLHGDSRFRQLKRESERSNNDSDDDDDE